MLRKLKHNISLSLWMGLFVILAWSCEHDEVYYQFRELKAAQWSKYDTLYFDIDSTSIATGVPYELSLEVTNNATYPYRNIWFFMQNNFATDSIFNHVEKQYAIADELGEWKGAGFGALYQISYPLDDVVFGEKRNYRIKVEHGMRDELLTGIEKVGIRISKKK